METLVTDDWTLDPAIFDFKPHWRPSQYQKRLSGKELGGYKLRYLYRASPAWNSLQDIPPANGREFTAEDVVFIITGCQVWAMVPSVNPVQSPTPLSKTSLR